MNLQIFNSIVNGELKPWLIDIEESTLKEIVRQSNKMPVNDLQQVANKLRHLLEPFNNIQKSIPVPSIQEIKQQAYSSNNIEATTLLQHYYKGLIDAALIIYYNETINNTFIKDNALDVPFQIGEKSLKGISVLCNQANNELKERGFDDVPPYTDIAHFALTYLRNNLLAIYFSIQKPFKEYLTNTYNSFEDYALYCLDDRNFEFNLIENETDSIEAPQAQKKTNTLTFGFRGDEERLLAVVKALVFRLYFLNEKLTTVEQFIKVFTAKDLKGIDIKIYIDCATNEFEEIMQQFKTVASKFTPTTISKSKLFYAKEGTLIDANLLYVTKSKSKLAIEKKELISAIFQNIRKEKG